VFIELWCGLRAAAPACSTAGKEEESESVCNLIAAALWRCRFVPVAEVVRCLSTCRSGPCAAHGRAARAEPRAEKWELRQFSSHHSQRIYQTVSGMPPAPAVLLPVFFFHGVLQDASTGANLSTKASTEGRRCVVLSFASGPSDSIRSLWPQVALAIAQIREVVGHEPGTFAAGYAFVGYSQGGLLARAVVQEMDDHNVRVLVTLAGVLNGMYFGPQARDAAALQVFLHELGPELVPSSVFDFAQYCSPAQTLSASATDSSTSDSVQVSGAPSQATADAKPTLAQRYQTDFDAFALAHPDLQQRYSYFNIARSPVAHTWTKSNAFLAELNNVADCDRATPDDREKDRARRRANFLKLDAAHLFASPDDGILSPWQTSILGQYSEIASAEALESEFETLRVLEVKETREYLDDTYGLRTLDERGGLHLHVLANVLHGNWTTDDVREGTVGFSEIYEHHVRSLLQVGDDRVDALEDRVDELVEDGLEATCRDIHEPARVRDRRHGVQKERVAALVQRLEPVRVARVLVRGRVRAHAEVGEAVADVAGARNVVVAAEDGTLPRRDNLVARRAEEVRAAELEERCLLEQLRVLEEHEVVEVELEGAAREVRGRVLGKVEEPGGHGAGAASFEKRERGRGVGRLRAIEDAVVWPGEAHERHRLVVVHVLDDGACEHGALRVADKDVAGGVELGVRAGEDGADLRDRERHLLVERPNGARVGAEREGVEGALVGGEGLGVVAPDAGVDCGAVEEEDGELRVVAVAATTVVVVVVVACVVLVVASGSLLLVDANADVRGSAGGVERDAHNEQ
ncbi:hypothetical protein PybrP1_001232, partial [[Pythium] brassicae (nom. inval.)]